MEYHAYKKRRANGRAANKAPKEMEEMRVPELFAAGVVTAGVVAAAAAAVVVVTAAGGATVVVATTGGGTTAGVVGVMITGGGPPGALITTGPPYATSGARPNWMAYVPEGMGRPFRTDGTVNTTWLGETGRARMTAGSLI